MNCCTECFSSLYLKTIINSNGDKSANCDFCLSEGSIIYNASELSLLFQGILDLYIVDEEAGKNIEIQVENDFPLKIFSNKITNVKRRELLIAILDFDYPSYSSLFDNPVLLSLLQDDSLVQRLQVSWSKFAEEIKSTNRFHIQNVLDLDKLKILLNRYSKPIPKGRVFFRGRISDKEGFGVDKMGNPPRHLAKSGRANPVGISYLYIADNLKTTLYETRASLLDFITIGKFRLKENINVINLRGNAYDPVLLAENDELEDFMSHLSFISKLEEELSKPNRRSDSELDYLPTQYLSEFIKAIGFDGVEYQSSLYADGYNIAIFNPEKFECISVEVQEISHILFEHTPVVIE